MARPCNTIRAMRSKRLEAAGADSCRRRGNDSYVVDSTMTSVSKKRGKHGRSQFGQLHARLELEYDVSGRA